MVNSSKYREQFDRVKRWYERFREIDQGRLHNRPSDYYQDDVYAFFLNCYHLKDWIKNDPNVRPRENVEEFINTNEALKLCADICNGLKHLKRDPRKSRSGKDPQFGKRDFRLSLPESTISVKYTIDTADGSVDAFELATKCLRAWEDFIASKIVACEE